MAVKLYDEALINKIRKWVIDDKITITSPDETRRLFQYRADIANDQPIQLPLIAVSRGKTINVLNTQKKPSTFDGITIQANNNKVVSLVQVPISLDYQIDIYTRYMAEGDEYIRNFVFNIINFPQLDVTIPYNNLNYKHNSNIRMTNEIQDNSDIPERLIEGQFTRYTIGLTIDDAYFWSVPVKDTLKIEWDGVDVELASDKIKIK